MLGTFGSLLVFRGICGGFGVFRVGTKCPEKNPNLRNSPKMRRNPTHLCIQLPRKIPPENRPGGVFRGKMGASQAAPANLGPRRHTSRLPPALGPAGIKAPMYHKRSKTPFPTLKRRFPSRPPQYYAKIKTLALFLQSRVRLKNCTNGNLTTMNSDSDLRR